MRLLLTSAGLSNPSITEALEKLLGKSAQNVKLAFVPTAANVEAGDKHWLIDDYNHCRRAGFEVDIVDISAVSKEIWLPRLQSAEVLFFGGGNTFHLMHWFQKSGLRDLLPQLLETRIYAGISAGSCVTGQSIYNSVQNLFGEKYDLEIKEGLNLVDFQVIPHLNSEYFPKIRPANLETASQELTETVYALDDNSAVVVNGELVEVVSEGKWYKFN
jgi:dipeptidase E